MIYPASGNRWPQSGTYNDNMMLWFSVTDLSAYATAQQVAPERVPAYLMGHSAPSFGFTVRCVRDYSAEVSASEQMT